ncbi:MAG: hypothetical protein H6759_05095 [Candidatus Nomurabacteria bacterium]|nr:MAG: hypothetical protein H6759_05095 [Candidatus Nomurabacteria bacterium]
MEEFSVMIGQQLIIQSMIDRIDKVRRHALNHINEPKILLDETWLIPTHELCDVLGVDSLEEILSSKIRGIALALAGKKEYHPRSIAGGAEQLMELLRPAADEEQAEDERKLRNRILGLAARYLSASVEERTKILISLEGSRTRALSDTEEVTELVRLRINADHEYERVSKQLRKLQVKNGSLLNRNVILDA